MRKRYSLSVLIIIILMVITSGLHAEKNAFKITSITFEGNNVYQSRTLQKVMVTRASKFLSLAYYYPEIFSEDLKNLALFYHQNGYLQAKISDYSLERNEEKKQLSIVIQVFEGEPTYIEGMAIFGNTVFSDSTLIEKIGLHTGRLLQQKKVQDATYVLLTMYANDGFLDAEVVPDIRVNDEHHRALIDFQITEHEQFSIRDIVIRGIEITKKKIIMRDLNFKSGEIVNYYKLLASQRALYLTGLFESIFIRPVTIDSLSSQKDILIEIKEKVPGEFNIGVGYGSLDKARIFAELLYSDLWGTAQKVSLSGKLSYITRKIEVSYTEPWTFGIKLNTDVNLFATYNEEPGYDVSEYGGKVIVGKSLSKYSSASIAYRYERAHFSHVKVQELPDKYNSNLNSLTLSAIHDDRDNIFNTTSGHVLSFDSEIATSYEKTTNVFGRLVLHGKYYEPITHTTIIALSLEAGGLTLFGNSTNIPLNERFYAGGPHSLRGFNYRKVGPLDNKELPIGGRYKLVNNIEIRQTIYKALGGVIFFDFGNVWNYMKDIKKQPMRSSPGIGLRIATPLGVVRCDYGFNWFPKNGEPSGKLYFSLGQAF